MNIRTNIILVLATFLMLIGDALASEVVKCPTKKSDTKIFQIPSMFQTSVSIESTSDKSNPISLATYRSVGNGKCDRHIVAEYSVEGGNPNVDSLFFYKYNKKLNIITIVHWDINHRGIGTYGRLYQIYAYEKNANDQFEENRSIINNGAMTGIDGYDDGRPSVFPLKTANDVKKALAKIP